MTEPASTDKVIESVVEDLRRRSNLGVKKYGTTLYENKEALRGRLQHAYEEALDLANYLKWSIMQLDEGWPTSIILDTSRLTPEDKAILAAPRRHGGILWCTYPVDSVCRYPDCDCAKGEK